jgi:SH3-like domain-containing protein
MIRKLAWFLILAILVPMLGGTSAASQRMAVKADVANVRAEPDTKADTLWEAEKYYPLVILEKKGPWYRFKDFAGDGGWVYSSLVDDTPTVVVKVNRANIRANAGTQYDVVFDAERGTPFKVLEKKGHWIKVQHSDGDSGWIFDSLVW